MRGPAPDATPNAPRGRSGRADEVLELDEVQSLEVRADLGPGPRASDRYDDAFAAHRGQRVEADHRDATDALADSAWVHLEDVGRALALGRERAGECLARVSEPPEDERVVAREEAGRQDSQSVRRWR